MRKKKDNFTKIWDGFYHLGDFCISRLSLHLRVKFFRLYSKVFLTNGKKMTFKQAPVIIFFLIICTWIWWEKRRSQRRLIWVSPKLYSASQSGWKFYFLRYQNMKCKGNENQIEGNSWGKLYSHFLSTLVMKCITMHSNAEYFYASTT